MSKLLYWQLILEQVQQVQQLAVQHVRQQNQQTAQDALVDMQNHLQLLERKIAENDCRYSEVECKQLVSLKVSSTYGTAAR